MNACTIANASVRNAAIQVKTCDAGGPKPDRRDLIGRMQSHDAALGEKGARGVLEGPTGFGKLSRHLCTPTAGGEVPCYVMTTVSPSVMVMRTHRLVAAPTRRCCHD